MSAREEELMAAKNLFEEAVKEEEEIKARIESLEVQAAQVIAEINNGAESLESYNLFLNLMRIESINHIAMKAKSNIFRVLAISKVTNPRILSSIVFDRNLEFSIRLAAIRNENCDISQQKLYELAKESPDDACLSLERLIDKNLLKDYARNFNAISYAGGKWSDYSLSQKDEIFKKVIGKITDDITLGELALISPRSNFCIYCDAIKSQTVLYDMAEKCFGKSSGDFSYVINKLDVEHFEKLFMNVFKNASLLSVSDIATFLRSIQSINIINYFYFSDLSDISKKEDRDAIRKLRKNEGIRKLVVRKLAELS